MGSTVTQGAGGDAGQDTDSEGAGGQHCHQPSQKTVSGSASSIPEQEHPSAGDGWTEQMTTQSQAPAPALVLETPKSTIQLFQCSAPFSDH